jgi:hypothetical protein
MSQPLQTNLGVMEPQLNPFEGTSGVAADKIEQSDKLKVAIIGPPKSGKSWFACTAPGFIKHYDFDDRKESLGLLPQELKVKINSSTLRDTLSNPTVIDALESDLSTFKYRKLKGLPIPDTYVFDTISNLIANGVRNGYLKHNPKDGRSIRIAGTTQQIGISYDLINVTTRCLEYFLTEFGALGNVIFVFHERDEKDKAESTPDKIKYTGLVTIEPQFAANILTLFNEVFRIQVIGSGVANTPAKFQVTCKPDNEMRAATTLMIDAIEPPNLMDMIKKHKQRKKELKK